MACSYPDYIGKYLNPYLDSFIDGSCDELFIYYVQSLLTIKVNNVNKADQDLICVHFCPQVYIKTH